MTHIYECPGCGIRVSTDDTTAGAFELPPDITCEQCDREMSVVITR